MTIESPNKKTRVPGPTAMPVEAGGGGDASSAATDAEGAGSLVALAIVDAPAEAVVDGVTTGGEARGADAISGCFSGVPAQARGAASARRKDSTIGWEKDALMLVPNLSLEG